MRYDAFKNGAPRQIMAGLGDPRFLDALETASSYDMLRKMIIKLNDRVDHGCFSAAAKRYAGVSSSGERELLKGLLLLCDFRHVADEIAGASAYTDMTRIGGDFRQAFASCVLNAPI